MIVKTPAPVAVTQIPAGTVASTSTGQSVTSADIASLIAAFQAQGASLAQAQQATQQTLQSAGVNTAAPAVQDAIAPPPAAGFFGLPLWVIVAGGGLALFLILK